MLKTALRIAAVLAALLSPSLASAQSYELLHEGAGEQQRAVCLGRPATLEFLRALHFQMNVLGKNYNDAADSLVSRVNGNGDINCRYLTSRAEFSLPRSVVDVVEADGLDPWDGMALYGVGASRLVVQGGTKLIRSERQVDQLYVIVTDMFVRKRP